MSDEPSDGEFAVIDRLRRRMPPAPPDQVWIGDDAAVLVGGLLVATDALVEGLDWDAALSTPADVGWKALMVNASDIAAMGGRTEHLLVTVAARPDFDIDRLYDGVMEACAELGATVVGGDLSSIDGPNVVSVTAIGRCPGNRPVLRNGASAGDWLWVTGRLGAAAAGLRMLRAAGELIDECGCAHRRPIARVDRGVDAAALGATAMIDISDGLAADAWHIARASAVGLDLEELPIAAGATADEAVAGGDDYELLCAMPHGVDLPGWQRIGAVVAGGPGVTIRGEPSEPRGYTHWRQP